MVTVISRSPEETFALGASWAREVQPGWLIGLTGDLGAGKTQLVKGLAQGLGIQGRISSPTFALVNEYGGGRLPLFHLDLYRLDGLDQIIAAGLEGYFCQHATVTVVEWAERWFGSQAHSQPARTGHVRRVWIESRNEEGARQIRYEDSGH